MTGDGGKKTNISEFSKEICNENYDKETQFNDGQDETGFSEGQTDVINHSLYEEICRLNGLFEVLGKVNHIMVRAKSKDKFFQNVCDILVKHKDFNLVWIGVNDNKTSVVTPVAMAGEHMEYVSNLVIFSDERPEGLGPTGTAIREGCTVICNDFFADPRTLPWQQAAKKTHIKTSAVVPFSLGGQVYGALTVYASKINFFKEKEAKLLKKIALCISFGLEHLEEEKKRKEAEQELRKLNANLEEKNAILDRSNTLFAAILESSPEVIVFSLDTNYCYTAFNKRHKDTIFQIWGREIGIGTNMLEIIRKHEDNIKAKENFDRALAGESFTSIEEYGDEKLSRFFWQDHYAPIYSAEGTIIGLTCFVLNITARREAEENHLYLSYHDALTGLYNRRFYEEEIKRLDTERNLPISIIVGDLNGLKMINDAFGHIKGDEILIKAADIIRSACRSDDIVARWGGDEFVILLPKTKKNEAEEIVKRIKDQYADEYVNAVRVSISFGWDTKTKENEEILDVLKSAEDFMYKYKIVENESMRGNVINTIINTLHEKNPREELHSKRVSEICENLGKAMGFSDIEVAKLKAVGLLHDIGKIAIEEGILNKSGILSDHEQIEIDRHPDIGYRILSSSHDMSEFASCVLAHHERWDGRGYPNGMKGNEIPMIARIIAIADSYDAMTSERTYRKALSEEKTLSEIINNAGTQFDPEVARAFVEKVLQKPWK